MAKIYLVIHNISAALYKLCVAVNYPVLKLGSQKNKTVNYRKTLEHRLIMIHLSAIEWIIVDKHYKITCWKSH